MISIGGSKGLVQFSVKLVLTLVLLAVVVFIGRVGVADFLRLEATTYIDKFNEGRIRLSMEQLAKARQRLLLVRSIDPGNPVVPEYLAQVSYIRAAHSGINKELQREYLSDALREYQLALGLRPNSGYLWAGKMTVMQLLMSLDETVGPEGRPAMPTGFGPNWVQMMAAMKHAIQLAPWEPGVLRQIMFIGDKYSLVLAGEDRQLFDLAKRNAVLLKLAVE
ncbi:hypothetical protein [Ferriphaselus sp. R-1]|uniref:hypothetical protein n=1 Tax=Ferriphaselus sp. R-1 TaxID=1485544 RepID=UPI000550D8BC|nr:hypothetical protein [Ferriphaselus sp. R-1]